MTGHGTHRTTTPAVWLPLGVLFLILAYLGREQVWVGVPALVVGVLMLAGALVLAVRGDRRRSGRPTGDTRR